MTMRQRGYFDKVLVANRGEIACRIMRTLKRLGIRTVAVFSEADARAMHVAMADEAVQIGGAAPGESYLRVDAILAACRKTGAQAVHPGYGFLSENEAFAAACEADGVTFIGPPASAIAAMGSKSAAKALMEKAGVPVVPGLYGANPTDDELREAAVRMGFPVLLKAAAGGGGKGMRRVDGPDEFDAALEGARREARKAFGDEVMLLEKYVEEPRHVEVQVFGDTHGNYVYLFERDCSIQRRHQKVIEEAPAPGLGDALRRRFGEAAVEAARAVGYTNAGTVEFIMAPDGAFYFLEMNTRLQVEHPVTEMVTGYDLVEWQVRVAAGEALPATQADLKINGHAMEARLYAEDPRKGFLPQTGKLAHVGFPEATPHVRVDAGVRSGDEVTVNYDPMIAKVIVWDETRELAARRLRDALSRCEIVGVTTNASFLSAIATHPDFIAAKLSTAFIARHEAALLPAPTPASETVLALAALYEMLTRASELRDATLASGDPYSPWGLLGTFRINADADELLTFVDGEEHVSVRVRHVSDGGLRLTFASGETCEASAEIEPLGGIAACIGSLRVTARVVKRCDELTILYAGQSYRLLRFDPTRLVDVDDGSSDGRLSAPMPGKVTKVLVADGATVQRGQPLLILEAMKMENTILAPRNGIVNAVRFAEGELVREGEALVDFTAKGAE